MAACDVDVARQTIAAHDKPKHNRSTILAIGPFSEI